MSLIKEEAMSSIERYLTTLDLKEPDRVPVWPVIDYLPINYYNITAQEMLEDGEKSQKAMEWLYNKLGGFDIVIPGGGLIIPFLSPLPSYFSSFYLDWRLPGRALDAKMAPQLVERSLSNPLITEKDYDDIIETGFFRLLNFKRAGIKDVLKVNKYLKKFTENTKKWWNHFKVPTFAESAGVTPFELLSVFRGSTNFMKDIYRYPEKIKNVSEFLIDNMILMGYYGMEQIDGATISVGSARASADFISIRHFEELFWPFFKKMVSKYIKDGFIVQLHMDTDWTDRLHYFKELPKGNVYLHLDERTNIFKAKEILGDHICLEGNLKPSLFTLGTPNLIEKATKEIIDKCAEGGGLIVGAEIPDDAKLENIKAMIDTCKTHGLYRK